jgi:hypothetical protein
MTVKKNHEISVVIEEIAYLNAGIGNSAHKKIALW